MNAKRKILVVDDDPVVRKSFDRVLSGKGYAVITAENGEQALQKLNSEKYDMVYTDIRMPGMSGLEVAETVKARQPWTPVVIITGYGNDAAEARAKAAGVANFLHKPLSPDLIEGSAKDALTAPAVVPTAPVKAEPAPASRSAGEIVKQIALFFAAPFIGLAYIAALPLLGLGYLLVLAGRAAAKIGAVRTVATVCKLMGLAVAAPFVGLAYVVFFPIVCLALLAWTAGRAIVGTGVR